MFADATAISGDVMIEIRRRRQALRRLPGAEEHQSARRHPGGGRRHRTIGVGQVDPDPLHQPPRGTRRRPHRRRRDRTVERHPQHPGDPPRDREWCSRSFNLFPHLTVLDNITLGTAQGAADAQGEGRGARHGSARDGQDPRAGEQVPRAAVGRPAAAGGDRACVGDESEGDVVRRADVGARSRDDRRGTRHDEGPGAIRA